MKLTRRKLSAYAAEKIVSGANVTGVMTEIAAYLVANGRTKESILVLRDIETRLLEHGVALVTLTSARELSKEALADIAAMLKREQGIETVSFNQIIDASVIGGVRIELPGQVADFTVKAKLDALVA